jgi:hypothetical protein
MEQQLTFGGGAMRQDGAMGVAARARALALSLFVSLLLSLSAAIVVLGVLLAATGMAVVLVGSR